MTVDTPRRRGETDAEYWQRIQEERGEVPPRPPPSRPDGFKEARGVEARSLDILEPFLERQAFKGRFVITSKGPLAKFIQATAGDVLFNIDRERFLALELKADATDMPNLFLETWSNRNLEDMNDHATRGSTLGWLLTNRADLLVYHRLNHDEVCVCSMLRLKRWAFGYRDVPGRIYAFPERRQSKHDQKNDTWGRCVPVDVLAREVPRFHRFRIDQLSLWGEANLAAASG